MGKVAWGFTCSIDGFIAGPGHDMSWLSASEPNPDGLTQQLADAVGVIISGRYFQEREAGATMAGALRVTYGRTGLAVAASGLTAIASMSGNPFCAMLWLMTTSPSAMPAASA